MPFFFFCHFGGHNWLWWWSFLWLGCHLKKYKQMVKKVKKIFTGSWLLGWTRSSQALCALWIFLDCGNCWLTSLLWWRQLWLWCEVGDGVQCEIDDHGVLLWSWHTTFLLDSGGGAPVGLNGLNCPSTQWRYAKGACMLGYFQPLCDLP